MSALIAFDLLGFLVEEKNIYEDFVFFRKPHQIFCSGFLSFLLVEFSPVFTRYWMQEKPPENVHVRSIKTPGEAL